MNKIVLILMVVVYFESIQSSHREFTLVPPKPDSKGNRLLQLSSSIKSIDNAEKKNSSPKKVSNSPNTKVGNQIFEIKDGKVIKGKDDGVIYIDDVPVAQDTQLESHQLWIQTRSGSLYVNDILVLKENPAKWPYRFPLVNQYKIDVTGFEIKVKNGAVFYSDNFVKNMRI